MRNEHVVERATSMALTALRACIRTLNSVGKQRNALVSFMAQTLPNSTRHAGSASDPSCSTLHPQHPNAPVLKISFSIMSRDNGNVHRAAVKIIVSKSRAARGSACNVLLSRVCVRASLNSKFQQRLAFVTTVVWEIPRV